MNAQITLSEASSFLGVSKATLRNWDKAKKLTAIRNPNNSYRMYNLEELVKLKGEYSTQESQPLQKQDTARKIKLSFAKVQSILRDELSDSNIITRFDEISKLLSVEFCAKREYIHFNCEDSLFSDSEIEFSEKIQNIYSELLKANEVIVPNGYEKINLPPAVLCRCVQELNKIDFSNSPVDIKGLAYEETLKDTFDKNANQQFFTPYQIVDFMVKLMKPFLKGVICDPACGTGGFLIKVARSVTDSKLIGMEIDERLAWISTMNLFAHEAKDFSVKYLKNGGSLGRDSSVFFNSVDSILTNPPFGSDYSDQNILNLFTLGKNRTSRRRGILFIEQSYNLLKPNGVVAIIIDRGVLNSKQNSDVQNFILSNCDILAIIDLPETAFMPYANVLASILVLQKKLMDSDHKKTFFAKAEKIGRKPNGEDDIIYKPDGTKELNSDFNAIISDWNNYLNDKPIINNKNCFIADIHSNIAERKSSRLDYIFHHPFINESEQLLHNSAYKLYTLADICSEHNELYIPAADAMASSLLFTGLANIESYTGIAYQTEEPAASIKSAVKRYEKGEILFSKMRPNLRKVALMNFENGGYASSECIVFSVRKNSDGEYIIYPELLSMLLRSDFVYGQVMGFVTGIGRPRISGKDLRSVKIPIPPIEIQKQAILVMKNASESSKKLREKAVLLKEEADNIDQLSINNITKIVSGISL